VKDGPTNYKIKDDCIGYLHRGQYHYNISEGYKTVFAYLKEFEELRVTRKAFLKNAGIRIACGNFSYAKIP